jgi:phospholipase/carboxylesterase
MGVTRAVRIVMPRAPDPEGNGYSWMPVSAHGGESPELRRAIAARVETLREAMGTWSARHPTRGKPILVGFSQGAILATTIAMQHPELVSAALPVATWLPPSLEPQARDRLATQVPIHALHGTNDPVLSASRTRQLFERLSRLGYPVTFEQYPETRHEVSPEMRERLHDLIEGAIRGLPQSERTSGNS